MSECKQWIRSRLQAVSLFLQSLRGRMQTNKCASLNISKSITPPASGLGCLLVLRSSLWIFKTKERLFSLDKRCSDYNERSSVFKEFYSYSALITCKSWVTVSWCVVCNNLSYSLLFHSLTKDMTGKVFS